MDVNSSVGWKAGQGGRQRDVVAVENGGNEARGKGGTQTSLFLPEALVPWSKPQSLESEFLSATSNM